MPASNHPIKSTDERAVRLRQDDFLRAYAATGTIRKAAEIVGIHRSTVSMWQKDDFFRDRFMESKVDFREQLEELAFQRLREQGAKDNPVLLITMLNAHYPEKYRTGMSQDQDEGLLHLMEMRRTVQAQRRIAEAEADRLESENADNKSAAIDPRQKRLDDMLKMQRNKS